MINKKKHLFDGCPESPVGLIDLGNMPHFEPQFSKQVRQFVPGFGFVEYSIEKGEPMASPKKKKNVSVSKAAASQKNAAKIKQTQTGKKKTSTLFKVTGRLRKEMRQSITAIKRIRLGLPVDMDPFDYIGSPVKPKEVIAEAPKAQDEPTYQREEFEVEIPQQPGGVFETLKSSKPDQGNSIHIDLREDVTGPSLAIQYDNELTQEQKRAGVNNGIRMEERQLKRIIRKLDRNTNQAANFMLQHLSPTILAYDAASKITQTTLRDGLGLETEIDPDIGTIVGELAKLDMAMFFVRKMRMPKTVKQLYVNKLTEGIVAATLTKIASQGKGNEIRSALEGYLARGTGRGSKAQPTKAVNRNAPDFDEAMSQLQKTSGRISKSRIGVRGSHLGRPIDGGF